MDSSAKNFGNYAFISYKREDEGWAKWLQRKLERYRLPSVIRTETSASPKFIRPVFRDNTDLSGGVLADNLRRELDDSRFLIVICSPAATRSEWVNKEVQTFIDQGRADRIIPFVVAGTPHAADPVQECFPAAIRALPAENELLGINVAEVGRERAFIRLVATMLGVKFDSLWQRHKRRERRRRIIAGAVAAVAVLIGLFAYDYNRSTYAYFMDYVDCFGCPEGLVEISREQTESRCGTFRFRYERTPFGEPGAYGWRLADVTYVNAAMRPVEIENSEWTDRSPILKLEYNKETGEVARQSYCDVKGKVRLRHVLSRRDGVPAAVADLIHSREQLGVGYASAMLSKSGKNDDAKSSIVRYVYTRDDAGRIVGQTFHANNDSRIDRSTIADADGIFGYRYTLDSLGRRTAVTYVGIDGRPVPNKKGVVSRRYSYDSFGNLVEVANHGIDGGLTLNEDLWAVCRNETDDKGRIVAVRFFDTQRKPTLNKQEAVAAQLRRLDGHGNTVEATYVNVDGDICNVRSGYARHILRYDSDGNCIEATVYNADGTPGLTAEGVHRYEYDYDSRGNCIEYRHFGTDGKPTLSKSGEASCRQTYDDRNNCTGWASFGIDGEPVADNRGRAAGKKVYDERDFIVEEAFFGVDGEPVNDTDGIARFVYRKDDRGNTLYVTCYDADGNKTTNPEWSVSVAMEYDERGNLMSWTNLDADGNPTYDADGVYIWRYAHDVMGNGTSVSYFDIDGRPLLQKDGTAGYNTKYDTYGNCTEIVNIDTLGQPTYDKKGVAITRYKYDNRRNRVERSYYGIDGEPIVNNEGIHRRIYVYDNRGNNIERANYNTDGKLKRDPDGELHFYIEYDNRDRGIRYTNRDDEGNLVAEIGGNAITEAAYDDRDNCIRLSYFGVDGKPVMAKDGYASCVYDYDSRNLNVRQSFFGIDGEPCAVYDVYAGELEYDDYGRLTSSTYLGRDGQPVMSGALGMAKSKIDYDAKGNIISAKSFDIEGNLCVSNYGYAFYKATYDRYGNQTEMKYYGADGKPMLSGGVCSYNKVFDRNGNPIETRNYGVDGKPMLNIDGWACQKLSRDRFGNITELSYFGVEGEPVEQNGYHREERDYNRLGYRTASRYFDKDGNALGEFVEVPVIVNVNSVELLNTIPVNSMVMSLNDWKVGDPSLAIEELTRRDRFKPNRITVKTPDGDIRTTDVDHGELGIKWVYRLIEKSQADAMRAQLQQSH